MTKRPPEEPDFRVTTHLMCHTPLARTTSDEVLKSTSAYVPPFDLVADKGLSLMKLEASARVWTRSGPQAKMARSGTKAVLE